MTGQAPLRADEEAGRPRRDQRRPAVLVVDGDRVGRRMAEKALARAEVEIEIAERAAPALEVIQYLAVDVVIADTMLEDATGLVLMDRAVQLCGPRAPAFVFLCASGRPNTRAAYLRSGAADVLAKPFDPDELCARVEAILGRRCRAPAGEAHVLAGDGETIPLGDVLAMLEAGRHSGILAVAAGATAGRIGLRDGRVCEASFGNLTGMAAALALLTSTVTIYRLSAAVPAATGTSRSVTELLLEAAVLHDHGRVAAASGAPADPRLAALGVTRSPIELRRRRSTSRSPERSLTRRDLVRRVLAALHEPMLLGDLSLSRPDGLADRQLADRFLTVDFYAPLTDGVAAIMEMTSPVGHAAILASLRGQADAVSLTWDLGGFGLVVRLVDIESSGVPAGRYPDGVIVAPPRGDVLGIHPEHLAHLTALADPPRRVAAAPVGGNALNRTVARLFTRCVASQAASLDDVAGGMRGLLARVLETWAAP